MQIDRRLLDQPAPASLGGNRRNADCCRRGAGGSANGPARPLFLPDDIPQTVGERECQRLVLGWPGLVEGEWLKRLRQVAAVCVNQRVAPGDELGERRVGQPIGEGTVRVAWEAPVEVLAVFRDDERASQPCTPAMTVSFGPWPDPAASTTGTSMPARSSIRRFSVVGMGQTFLG